jgi:glucoamylase
VSSRDNPRLALGGPGIEPTWTRTAKVAVGTAYSTSGRLWYTFDEGCVTEVYYPTIDSPQIRDLQLLVTDGETFFHDERRSFVSEVDCISRSVLGFYQNFWIDGRPYWRGIQLDEVAFPILLAWRLW